MSPERTQEEETCEVRGPTCLCRARPLVVPLRAAQKRVTISCEKFQMQLWFFILFGSFWDILKKCYKWKFSEFWALVLVGTKHFLPRPSVPLFSLSWKVVGEKARKSGLFDGFFTEIKTKFLIAKQKCLIKPKLLWWIFLFWLQRIFPSKEISVEKCWSILGPIWRTSGLIFSKRLGKFLCCPISSHSSK